ncbi:hypothetical protein ACWC2K_38935 [Streptomyces chattanoogensis]
MAAPLLPILVVTVVDIRAPPDVHLGPFLADAPAITASFGSPRITAFLGVMAVPAQVVVVAVRTSLTDLNHSLQITALILISAFVTFIAYGRERNERELTQLKSVAKTAPGVAKGATPLTGKGGSAQARPASEAYGQGARGAPARVGAPAAASGAESSNSAHLGGLAKACARLVDSSPNGAMVCSLRYFPMLPVVSWACVAHRGVRCHVVLGRSQECCAR